MNVELLEDFKQINVNDLVPVASEIGERSYPYMAIVTEAKGDYFTYVNVSTRQSFMVLDLDLPGATVVKTDGTFLMGREAFRLYQETQRIRRQAEMAQPYGGRDNGLAQVTGFTESCQVGHPIN
jgi:hypothetical protein